MDEDLGVKAAPVTRLRKRLSVDAEDSPLPTTPSTPTKKRTTRLAAKPQLELIDEVVPENVPKKATRKAAAVAAVKESVDTEAITGTSTPVTPSRRSTRIKSNTSILSETTSQSVESPRAKRALRRKSQLGSDTESAAVTPARQTRRTRKNSTTSADKPGSDTESAAVTPARQITQTRKNSTTSVDVPAGDTDKNVVVYVVTSTNSDGNPEEPGRKSTKDSTNENDVSPSTRKSPRLNKNGNKSDETDNVTKEMVKNPMNSCEQYTKNTDKYAPGELTTIKSDMVEIINEDDTTPKDNEKENLSTSSFNAMSDIKTYIKKTKSTSSVEKVTNDLINARPRTKSWTTLTSPSNGHEGAKVQNKTISSMSGSGDGLLNDENNCESNIVAEKNVNSPNRSVNKSKLFMLNTSVENKENLESLDQLAEFEMNKSKSDTAKLFENSPSNQKALVLIDDCDSCSVDKFNINIKIEGDNQCVPIVANPTSESPSKCNQSVEPMDIDESIPGSVTILDIDDFSDEKSNISKEEVEVPDKKTPITEKCLVKNISNSKRKSSISRSEISISSTPKRISISEDDKNKSIKNSSNSAQEKFNDTVNEEPIRISSSKQIADEEVYNESSKLTVSGEENIAKLNGESLNKSPKKSSISINRDNTENSNESSNKSNEKLSISHGIQKYLEEHNDESKSSNKPEKTSSDSQTESSNLEKSANENKSTLVISQLKDIPAIDINNAMSPNHTNELSKSMDGPDVQNKGIDRKNYSLKKNNIVNYLTSTPIQEKPVQNLTMQINTSIISPAVENKNKTSEKVPQKGMETSDSDSSDEKTSKKNPQKNISNNSAKKSVVAPKKKFAEAPSSSESSDYETEAEPKSDTKTVLRKSPSTKKPDLDSSDSESETEHRPKPKIKKSQKKKAPALECSETDEESKTELKTRSKIDLKQVPNLESSDSDVESETAPKTQGKIDIKKVPALDSPDSSEEELDSKNQQNKKTPINKVDRESNSESKAKAQKIKTPSKKYPTSDSSDSDSSEEAVSKDKSKIFDDEASDAGDNYESGDSQDEEDRRYEAENEIAVKGETLDSEEEFSNDSDYENDSFVVDSDAEDEDMLSGTGDDLSMSDNELTMSSKSKKKYNERKLKQQKKASREMYEARHKDESANSSKPKTVKSKKPKRQRLESSTQESENENSHRLNSITKSDSDESVGIKKKKPKRLSESVCDITMNEKEITILNEGTENKDPLSVAIKQEPKTPQRKFNMSTVAINDKIEEVQVDVNGSIMRDNDTLDPLQATMAADDEEDSSSSDNMEIIQNYESVLNNLSSQTKKVKTVDTSLNLNKKVKDSKEPVIDQLNLTQTKKSKKDKNKTAENNPTESVKSKATDLKPIQKEDDSSDSIDMKLLFPEDSNDSDIHASQFKPKVKEPEENFIPLKRTEAKTNLHENTGMNISLNESALNTSKKKNKKRKSSQFIPEEEITCQPDVSEEPEDCGIKIIMDTTGTYDDDDLLQPHNSSKKKKNKKNKSLNEEGVKIIMDTTGTYEDDIPQPDNSNKKKKNKKNKSLNEDGVKIIMDSTGTYEDDIPQPDNTNKKKKNTKNTSLNEESGLDVDCTDGAPDIPIEVSFKSEKKNKSFNVSANNIEKSFIAESHSEKKSKKKSESTSEFVETLLENSDNTTPSVDVMPVNVSIKSDKKKKKNKTDVSLITESVVETMSDNTNKRPKKTRSVEEVAPQMTMPEPSIEPAETSISSEKKKKKKKNKQNLVNSSAIVYNTGEESDDAPMEMSYKSVKKSDTTDNVTDDAVTSTEKNKRKKNKKKKNKNLSQTSDKSVETVIGQNDGTKKRKRKASDSPPDTEDANSIPSGTLTSSENKKRKILLDDECISAYSDNEQSNSKKSKKNKSKNYGAVEQGEVLQQTAKKRKYRDDDDDPEDKTSKIIKQSSFDKIHVPKLPESILKQLSDKPQNKISKAKNAKVAIATMPFVVEEAERRKNKPSNYLEQSVYLNDDDDDDSPVKKKQKRSKHKKPKVLPFIPTAVISESGYTSKFNINVLPKEAQFVAQASNVENFRESFLGSQRIKKMGTLERCKIQRSHKISKF